MPCQEMTVATFKRGSISSMGQSSMLGRNREINCATNSVDQFIADYTVVVDKSWHLIYSRTTMWFLKRKPITP